MRAPRHRFSDSVRSTTRSIAAVMVEEGAVAETPDELEAWLSARPHMKVPLEEGGYNTAFGAADLFPLLKAMVGPPGEPVTTAAPQPRRPGPALLAGGALVVAVVLGVIIGLLA
jgi:hypothetical protein